MAARNRTLVMFSVNYKKKPIVRSQLDFINSRFDATVHSNFYWIKFSHLIHFVYP
jgi:hypothetical protein